MPETLRAPAYEFQNGAKKLDLSALTSAGATSRVDLKNRGSELRSTRSQLGAFFSPYWLARKLVRQMLNLAGEPIESYADRKFLEPAAGLGVFALAYIDEVLERARCAGVHSREFFVAVVESVHCIEIDKNMYTIMCSTVLQHLTDNYAEYMQPYTALPHSMNTNAIVRSSNASWKLTLAGDLCGKCDVRYGFDFVATNPPFNLIKPNAKRGTTAEELTAFSDWKSAEKEAKGLLGTQGVQNWYRIFLGRIMQSFLKSAGSFAIIVPATLLADATASDLRKELLAFYELGEVSVFRENDPIFPGVSQSIVAFTAKDTALNHAHGDIRVTTDVVELVFSREDLVKRGGIIPQTRITPIFAALIESAAPNLMDTDYIQNVRGEVDVTKFSSAIVDLAADTIGYPPLIRGANIKRFSSADARQVFVGNLSSLGPKQMLSKKRRLVSQQISQHAQVRRLNFMIVPAGVLVANSCNVLAINGPSGHVTEEALLAYMNSAPVNERFKWTSSNNHVSNGELGRIPLPHAHDVRWKQLNELGLELCNRVTETDEARVDIIVLSMHSDPCCG